jgi:hypothetical protein
MGLPPPDPRSLCPLSSTEFVEPSSPPTPYKNPGYATAANIIFVTAHTKKNREKSLKNKRGYLV